MDAIMDCEIIVYISILFDYALVEFSLLDWKTWFNTRLSQSKDCKK